MKMEDNKYFIFILFVIMLFTQLLISNHNDRITELETIIKDKR